MQRVAQVRIMSGNEGDNEGGKQNMGRSNPNNSDKHMNLDPPRQEGCRGRNNIYATSSRALLLLPFHAYQRKSTCTRDTRAPRRTNG